MPSIKYQLIYLLIKQPAGGNTMAIAGVLTAHIPRSYLAAVPECGCSSVNTFYMHRLLQKLINRIWHGAPKANPKKHQGGRAGQTHISYALSSGKSRAPPPVTSASQGPPFPKTSPALCSFPTSCLVTVIPILPLFLACWKLWNKQQEYRVCFVCV